MVPDVRERFLGMVDRLDDVLMRDPERGRESLREVLEGERIKLKPDESRSFLVAEYALGGQGAVTCGYCGSGGPIWTSSIPEFIDISLRRESPTTAP
jgi:hypothetical protein